MRQLFDFKTGARRGPWGELMKPVVASLSVADLMAVSAFVASIEAPGPGTTTTASQAR
jgi:cytochrome c553